MKSKFMKAVSKMLFALGAAALVISGTTSTSYAKYNWESVNEGEYEYNGESGEIMVHSYLGKYATARVNLVLYVETNDNPSGNEWTIRNNDIHYMFENYNDYSDNRLEFLMFKCDPLDMRDHMIDAGLPNGQVWSSEIYLEPGEYIFAGTCKMGANLPYAKTLLPDYTLVENSSDLTYQTDNGWYPVEGVSVFVNDGDDPIKNVYAIYGSTEWIADNYAEFAAWARNYDEATKGFAEYLDDTMGNDEMNNEVLVEEAEVAEEAIIEDVVEEPVIEETPAAQEDVITQVETAEDTKVTEENTKKSSNVWIPIVCVIAVVCVAAGVVLFVKRKRV